MKLFTARWRCTNYDCAYDHSAIIEAPDGTSMKNMKSKLKLAHDSDEVSQAHKLAGHSIEVSYTVQEELPE